MTEGYYCVLPLNARGFIAERERIKGTLHHHLWYEGRCSICKVDLDAETYRMEELIIDLQLENAGLHNALAKGATRVRHVLGSDGFEDVLVVPVKEAHGK